MGAISSAPLPTPTLHTGSYDPAPNAFTHIVRGRTYDVGDPQAPPGSECSRTRQHSRRRTRDAVGRLRNLRIIDLRNRVGHKEAYRPTAGEVEPCREGEIVFLHRIRDLFGVGEFDEFGAGAVEK